MHLRKGFILVLCAMLALAGLGCKSRTATTDITDPSELDKLWQEYFYDSIATIGNSGSFTAAAEIRPVSVAEFCWFKYINEHGRESLAPAGPDSSLRLLPLATVLEYAERYFGLTSLDVSKIPAEVYDPGRHAFLFAMEHGDSMPAYDSGKAWGFKLTKATRSGDGTITAVLSQLSGDLTIETETYTLKPRKDGGLRFVSGAQEYVNNHLVSITGDYTRFEAIKGFEGETGRLTVLGEAGGKVVFAYTPGLQGEVPALLLVKPETMALEKKLELTGRVDPGSATLTADGIVVRQADRVVTVDTALTHAQETMLPPTLAEKAGREGFWGYDVSQDMQKYVYADDRGLNVIDLASNQETLIPSSESRTQFASPRFVAGGRKIIATVCGYDGPIGYAMYDLTAGTWQTYHFASRNNSTDSIHHDTGVLEVNVSLGDASPSQESYSTVYLDFASGEVKRVDVTDPGDSDEVGTPYVGQSYAAFTTVKYDGKAYTFHVNRLDLGALQVKPAIVSLKGTDLFILGVLADGRVIFWYDLNPSERGICITK